MELQAKIENPARPVLLYEQIPPELGLLRSWSPTWP